MKDNANEKRREFLKKAGKFAVYTPPAILLMMNPSLKAFAKSAGGNLGGNRPNRENNRNFNSRLDRVASRMQSRIDSIRARFR